MTSCANVRFSLTAASLLAVALLVAMVPTGTLAQTESGDEHEFEIPIEKQPVQLPIGLTEEEKTRLHEIGENQIVTAPPVGTVREAAEWEPLTGVLVRYDYGFGLPYEVLQEMAEDIKLYVLCVASQQTTCSNNLSANGVNMANVELLDMDTNSIWTRDYGPQIVYVDGVWSISDWVYNRPRPLDDNIPWLLGTEWGCTVYGSDLVATGGNFMSDGHGTGFATDLIWDENTGMTHTEIAQDMQNYLGISNYVVIEDISDSGIHHIDVWAKLLSEETILVQQVDPAHEFYAPLEDRVAYLSTLTNCYGRPYNIVRLYCADIGGGDVAGHINALILNNKVFVPTFGVSSDATALATFQAAMPGYQVFGYEDGWLADDAIHCRGMEIHDQYMLRVDTNPLQDQLFNIGGYHVNALIDDMSETGLIADSLIVYWRVAGSPTFNAITMSSTAYPDSYYADIPQQAPFTDIEYYVFAGDNSGRREHRPMVSPAAWYTFNTGELVSTCSVLPSYLDFGTVFVGSYLDTVFTIKNVGDSLLTGTVSESCDHYSIISGVGAFSLAADESVMVTVRFEPTATGTHVCSIETGEAICADVSCTGVGDTPPVCAVVPDNLDFGTVLTSSYKDTTFIIKNTGGSLLTGDVGETCSHYSVVSGGGPFSLAADESVTVTVRFEPTSLGTHVCSLETGQAICSDVACTGYGELAPVCSVVPDNLDFGPVAVGGYKDTTFLITNTGGSLLAGDVTEACDNYEIISGGGPFSLAASQSVAVEVRYTPTATSGGETTYDFQTGGGIDKWFYASLDCASQPPGTPPDATEITTYTGIAQSDDNRYSTSYNRRDYPVHDFRFAIQEAEGTITQLYVEWEGYATDIYNPLWLYIWDSDANAWVQIESTLQESGDAILSGTFTTDIARFVDGSGYLWLAANFRASTSSGGGGTFYTDNVKVIVSTGTGPIQSCSIETGQAICSDVACTGESTYGPVCSVVPENLDFGTVPVGSFKDTTFTIKNLGDSLLVGDVSETCDHYSVISGGGPFSLAADESVTVSVRFEPTAEGTQNCSIETGQAICSDVSATGYGEPAPVCSVVPDNIDFGTVVIGDSLDATFVIKNTGGSLLTGDVSEPCAHYDIISGGGPYSLAADESVTVTVRFEPTAEGTQNCSIETGQAICSDVSATGYGEPAPVCSVTPDNIDFGTVVIGNSNDLTFVIKNTGGSLLTGDVSEPCAHYDIISGGGVYSLAADESVTVTIRFEPTAAGTQNCSIETGQAICSDVSATGYGEPAPVCSVTPDNIDFGTVVIGNSNDLTFVIKNTGGSLLTGDVSEPCAHYDIISGGGVYSLAADESVTVTIRFEPTAEGTQNCSIETGQAICSDVSATGYGEPAPVCSVVPDNIDFGTVVIGNSNDLTFVIKNTGGSLLTGDVSEPCAHYDIISGGGVYSLAADESVTVTVRFEPTAAGTQNCSIETGQAICSDVSATGYGEPAPVCSVTPDNIDFGTVVIGNSSDLTFVIKNTGGSLLTGDVSEPCAHYDIISGGGPYSLAADESVTVSVRFEPTAEGTQNCSIETGQAICSDVSATGYGEPAPVCSVTPDTIDFGTVVIGNSNDLTFVIKNTGGSLLTGDVSEPCAHYDIISGGGPYSLAADESVTVTVRFEPTDQGTQNCSIETGQAICSDVSATGYGEPAPVCSVTPDNIDFGTVVIGNSNDLTFVIKNTGGSLLTGDVSEPCAHYDIISGGGPYSLAADESVTVTVRFEPTDQGTQNCSIETGQAICSDVSATGYGEPAPVCSVTPDNIDFGTVVIGNSNDLTFVIKNTGGSLLTGDVSEPCDHYDIISGGGVYSLAADESVTVTIRFEPTAAGTQNCSIEIGQAICSDVAATGYGEPAPVCSVVPDNIDFGTVVIGDSLDATFVIKNAGGSLLTGDVSEPCAHYDIISGGGVYSLAADESVTVTIRFEPTAAGTQNCSIETGQAICSDVSATGYGEPAPICSVTPDNIDFGTVVIGNSNDLTFVIKNTGGSLLTGDVSEPCAHYDIISGGGVYSLAADESITVTVRFEPTAAGTQNCSIETGQAICSDVSATGYGEPAPVCSVTPDNIDFGTVVIGNSSDLTFVIKNTGGSLLTGDVSEPCDHYDIISGGGVYSLAADESVTVSVRFEPTAAGTQNCSIETGQAICSDVSATGYGEPAPVCSVTPDNIDFGTVVIGNSNDLTFVIKNTGGSLLTGDVSEPCDHYDIISGGGVYSLAADESVTVSVRFEPTAAGTQNCSIETGQAICSDVSATGYGEPAPVCLVVPDNIDFGTVHVWDYRDTSFTITNVGTEVLNGEVIRPWCPSYNFLSGGGVFSLDVAESLVVTLRFAPADTGQLDCTLETGIEDCGFVQLSGFGVDTLLAPITPQLPGWPNQVAQGTASSCKIADIDGDTYPDVVVGSNYIHAWHGDGTEMRDGDSDPLTSGILNTLGDSYAATVALADIDGNPGAEIIAASWNTSEVYIFDHDGNTLPGWPQSTGMFCWASPVVGDIDCDGDMEIIANSRIDKVYAWHHDGTEVRDGDNNYSTHGVFYDFATNSGIQNSTPALADMDGDGVVEIIICANADSIYCLNGDGSAVPGWPVPVLEANANISASPVVGDIDGDGYQEVIVRNSAGWVYGYNHDGTTMSGWPQYVSSYWHFVGSPALGDLTGDGKLEIAIPSMNGYCYLFRYDGSSMPNWPRPYAPDGHTESSPTIADMDEDGNLDIILTTENGYFNAWNVNGDYVSGFPMKLETWVRGTPVAVDLDLDGDLELITSCWVDQNVYVWDFDADAYEGCAPWNGFHGDNLNSGWTECDGEAPPTSSVQPDTLDFGVVLTGSYKDSTFTITNTGSSTLSGDVSETCDHYEIISGGGPYNLTTGQFVTVTVRFSPISAGTLSCSIETGSCSCGDVYCTGIGESSTVCLVQPDTLDFGTVSIGSYLDTTFTITNTGGGVLNGDVSEPCDHYDITSGGGPYALTASQSRVVTVRFAPTYAGTLSCTVETGAGLCSDVYCGGICIDDVPPPPPEGFILAYDQGSGNSSLTWNTSPAGDFDHFNIYRSENPDLLSYTPIDSTWQEVHSTSDTTWVDTISEGWRYRYVITAVDHAGNESDPSSPDIVTGITQNVMPEKYELHQNIPNPFNPTTTINYDVPPGGGKVTLRIYDVGGRLVRTLVNKVQSAGRKTVTWDARNDRAESVATGVYFYRMAAPGFDRTRKMVLLK